MSLESCGGFNRTERDGFHGSNDQEHLRFLRGRNDVHLDLLHAGETQRPIGIEVRLLHAPSVERHGIFETSPQAECNATLHLCTNYLGGGTYSAVHGAYHSFHLEAAALGNGASATWAT